MRPAVLASLAAAALLSAAPRAAADLPFRGERHQAPAAPAARGAEEDLPPEESEEEPVAGSTFPRKQMGFHGLCGASALVPPLRAGFDCNLGVRLGSSFQVLAEGGFYGDEKLYSVLFAVGGRIHGAVFDSDTLAAHGDFKVGGMSSNGVGDLTRSGLEWDAVTFKFGFGFTLNISKHSDLDVSGAVLLPVVTGRGNTQGLTSSQVASAVSPVQGQFTIGIDFDWPGHGVLRAQVGSPGAPP